MTVDAKLLDVLVCPVSRQPVFVLDADRLARLNELIRAGAVESLDGTALSEELTGALITRTGATLYPVEDGIPIMLEHRAIAVDALEDF